VLLFNDMVAANATFGIQMQHIMTMSIAKMRFIQKPLFAT